MIIRENVSFSAGNVISYRGKKKPLEMNELLADMEKYIKINNAEKSGPMIMAAYSIDEDAADSDVGIYIPLNKEIPSSAKFIFMPAFEIINCAMVKYKGYPHLVLYAGMELLERAYAAGLSLKLPLYNVYVYEPDSPEDIDKFEIDIHAEKEK